MNKKRSRLFLSITALMFCIGIMCFGVYAATSVSYTLSGTITYDVNDVFVDIDTTLYASNKDLYISQSNIAEDMHSISSALESGTSVPTANLDTFPYVDHQSSLNNVGDGEMPYVAKTLDLNYGSYVADTTSYAYYLAITISNYADETISTILNLDSLYDLNANVIITPERTMENIPAGTSDSPSKVCLVFGLILDNPAQSIDISFDGVKLSVNRGELQETPGLSFTAIDNGEAYSVSSGTADAERLVIPAYHDGKPVTTANIGVSFTGAYRQTKPWKEIYFPNTLTTISNYGITSSPNLRCVQLPQSLESIGQYFLDACVSIKTLYIPENVTSYDPASSQLQGVYVNLYSLFVNENNSEFSTQDSILYSNDKTIVYKCPGKQARDVELISSVTSIGIRAFYGCTSLSKITIPSGVKSIGDEAFYECTSLSEITIPSGVTSIGFRTFFGCTSLTSITIPSSVTSIGNIAFWGCEFTNVIYSTSGDGYTFENGTLTIFGEVADDPAWYSDNINPLITKVVFSNSSIKSIGNSAFVHCSSLSEITIPSGVTRIGDDAFFSCTNLKSATFEDSDSVWTVGRGGDILTITISEHTASELATYLKSTFSSHTWTKNV